MSNAPVAKLTSPVNKRRSIEELKLKYESPSNYETPKISNKPKSPRKLMKSKVKQMASMFNSKINQIIKRETEVGKYSALVNEFSPEPIPQVIAKVEKPVPLPRTRLNKRKAPVPTPRTTKLTNVEPKFSSCLVHEEVFAKMSVKDKAKLYSQFVEEMRQKSSEFAQKEDKLKQRRGAIIVERQSKVKDLLEELEFNTVFPKTNNTKSKVLQRLDSMKRALEARKQYQANTSVTTKSKEFEDILESKRAIRQKKVKSLPRLLATTETPFTEELKSNNNLMFPNQQLEDLFFSWFKENQEKKEGQEDLANHSEIDEEKQKSAIDKLLEEAIVKLESLEAEQKSEAYKTTYTSSSAKSSETEEYESGVSSLPKSSSEENPSPIIKIDFEFAQPLRPLRKKKLSRKPAIKKEVSPKANNQTNSTDSESETKQNHSLIKNKKLFLQPSQGEKLFAHAEQDNSRFEELNLSLMRQVNSPRKIKSAYTLTVMETPLATPRSSMNFAKLPAVTKNPPNNLVDTLTDQGFETATNDNDSPFKRFSLTSATPEVENSPLPFCNLSSSSKNNFGFSTPIKTQEHHSFAKQQLFSPISKPLKNRRKPLYVNESRRSSLAMQVIQEDQPLENPETSRIQIQQNFNTDSIKKMPKNSTNLPQERTSLFWINCGDFSVSLEINFNDNERLRLLYEIFSQTSCDTKDLHFGIDDHKFSVHGPLDMENISARIPASKETSHFWFSTGDLAIPFSGKQLSAPKIQRLFRLLKETVEETGILRFGVDEVEFSNVSEFWHQPAKFSMESQYSMLVGLQSGNSNGLEDFGKFAWPHSKPVLISDLDDSVSANDSFEEIECGRLSYSPFGSNHYDLSALDNEELSMPRNSKAMMSLESYCKEYENEPLDQLFDESFRPQQIEQPSQQEEKEDQNMSVAEMLYTVEQQQDRLSEVQEHLANYVKPSFISKDSLDHLQGTPEYLERLKSIVADISNIGCSNNFKQCSLLELESYMHFLSRYAEICLNSCSKHMDTVLEALVDYKAVVV